jgi:hypothetical protein
MDRKLGAKRVEVVKPIRRSAMVELIPLARDNSVRSPLHEWEGYVLAGDATPSVRRTLVRLGVDQARACEGPSERCADQRRSDRKRGPALVLDGSDGSEEGAERNERARVEELGLYFRDASGQ